MAYHQPQQSLGVQAGHHELYPWLIWALAAAFFFAEYLARVAPSVMVPDLLQAFHVNALSLGVLSGFFYVAFSGNIR